MTQMVRQRWPQALTGLTPYHEVGVGRLTWISLSMEVLKVPWKGMRPVMTYWCYLGPPTLRFRGTPLLVQLFVIYYGLPEIGIQLSPLSAALIGFSLNMAAYTCEILRSAIANIEPGQWEAAASLGMNRRQTLRRIIVPQAARTALPPLGNSFISLVKDTSLAATIQVPELLRQAQLITARTFEVFAMYISAAIIYWLIASVLAVLQERLEQRANRPESSSPPSRDNPR